mgnify:CR=1 FL=1
MRQQRWTHPDDARRQPDPPAGAPASSSPREQPGRPTTERLCISRASRASVAEVVQRQAEAGIDVPSDGEFGKSHQLVAVRARAPERLRAPARAARRQPVPARRRPRRASPSSTPSSTRATARQRSQAPRIGRGLRRPDHATPARPRSSATSTTSRPRSKAAGVAEGFLPVAAPASVIPDRKNEYYKSEEELLRGDRARRCAPNTARSSTPGLLLQLDDARAAVTYDRMVPPASFAGLPQLGRRCTSRCSTTRIEGIPRGAHPLPRLLGQLARAAHHRRAAQGHRRPHPAACAPAPT